MTALATNPAIPKTDPRRTYTPQGSMVQVWKDRTLELLHDGPAGTGKTLGICELCHLVCMKYPGTRILWVMKRRVTMNITVLNTFEGLVLPEGCPLMFGPTKEHRTKYRYPNGSEIILRGLDDPEQTRGVEANWVVVFEATNVTENDHEILLRCLRWGRGVPYKRIICDTNPGVPQHWLLQRVANGSMKRIPSKHTDNPRFYDAKKKQLTPEGKQYIEDVLGAMTGSRRARLKDGLWTGDENAVFDADVLLEHRTQHGEDPLYVGTSTAEGKHRDTLIRRGDLSHIRWTDAPEGALSGPGVEWKLWCEMHRDPKTGLYRPDQSMQPISASDVSWGQGASNSVICMGDRRTGRKIAEFASAQHGPEEFARIIAMAGWWFGGVKRHAFCGWEYNGPGASVTKIMADTLAYPWCYTHKTRKRGRAEQGEQAIVGWLSSRQSKVDLALELRDAYASGEYTNPSLPAIDETMTWIRYRDGSIGPAAFIDETPEARATHGDRTIADMLLVHLMGVAPLHPMRDQIERGSIAERQAQEELDDEDEY